MEDRELRRAGTDHAPSSILYPPSSIYASPQGGLLVMAIHAVEILHGHAAGAAHEIVLAGKDDDPAMHHAHGDVEEIAAVTILGSRQMLDHAHERCLSIIRAEQLQ